MAENDQKLQQIYLQMQMINQQIQGLEAQAEQLNMQIGEIQRIKDSLGELGSVKVGSNTFSPIGQGVFVESAVKDTAEVLVNAGAGVFLKKSVPDAQKTISKQIELSSKYFEQITAQLQMLNQQAAALQEQGKTFIS